MCTLVMSYEDPLGVAPSSKNDLVGIDESDTSIILGESPENKVEEKTTDPETERKPPVQLYNQEEIPPAVETNTEDQNAHHLHANSWCIAVVTIVLCLLFFLYYCF